MLKKKALVAKFGVDTADNSRRLSSSSTFSCANQLRFYLPSDDPKLELLGETAMYMCEESSLYLAVNTNMTFNEYSFWPLDVLACAGASGCVLG